MGSVILERALERLGLRSSLARIGRFAGNPADVPESERNESALHRAFYGNSGAVVHKWRHYLALYDRYLARFRGQPVRVLEIGVSKGGSLQMWRAYFGEAASIFGIDIDPRCAVHNGAHGQVRIGSQADPAFLERVLSEMGGGIDVVIDDGSHVASHQRVSFEKLFPRLSPNGVYICEDTHSAYWPKYGGGYRRRTNFIELAKTIVDDIHADFHAQPEGLADASRSIGGVHFHNSIVVIEKAPQARPTHLMVPAPPLPAA